MHPLSPVFGMSRLATSLVVRCDARGHAHFAPFLSDMNDISAPRQGGKGAHGKILVSHAHFFAQILFSFVDTQYFCTVFFMVLDFNVGDGSS